MRALRPGKSRAPWTTRFSAPSVPAAEPELRSWVIALKSVASLSGTVLPPGPPPLKVVQTFSASNGSTPLREALFHRRPSMAACSTRRSVVNDCSAPAEPPVRTSAMRSAGRSSRSTNACSARRVFWRLSTESPRSSTTSANVRWMSSRLRGGGGLSSVLEGTSGSRGAGSRARSGPLATGTNWANATVSRLPSWRTSKSAAVRSVTMRPSRSVTTASIRTASTPTLKRGTSRGCCADIGVSRRIARTMAQIAAIGVRGVTASSLS